MATNNEKKGLSTGNQKHQEQIQIEQELFPIFSGIFFGYNLALIAGEMFFSETLLRTDYWNWKEASLWGALVGCLFVFLSGKSFQQRIGILKIGVSISLLSSFFGGLIFLINPQFNNMFNVIRFFIGITVGLSCVAPVYLVEEVRKKKQRGSYFSWYQLAITVGILIAYIVMIFLSFLNKLDYYQAVSFFVCTILSIVYFFTLARIDSPIFDDYYNFHNISDYLLFLAERKHKNNRKELKKEKKVINELLEESPPIKQTPYNKVFRTPVIVGIIIIAIQQIAGINIVIYKFSDLLPLFGVDTVNGKLFFMVIIGIINVLSTIPGMLMIDRIGRKPLYLLGMCGIILSLSVLTFLIANVKPVYEIIPEKFCLGEKNNCIKCDSIDKYIKGTTLWLGDPGVFQSGTKYAYDRDFFEKKIVLPNEPDKTLFIETEKDSKISEFIIKSAFKEELKNKKEELKGNDITFVFNLKKKGLELTKIKHDGPDIDITESKVYQPTLKFMFGGSNDYGLLFFISLVVVYIIFFASTLGILGWLVPAEIIPIKIRSQGMAIIAATHWGINILIVALFRIELATAFFITFTILSAIALVFGYYFPETNSKKLMHIDYFWRGGGTISNFNKDEKFNKIADEVEREVKKYKDKIFKYKEQLEKEIQEMSDKEA